MIIYLYLCVIQFIYIKPLGISLPAFLKEFLQCRKCLLWLPGPTYTSTHVTPCHSLAPTQCVSLWEKNKNRTFYPALFSKKHA